MTGLKVRKQDSIGDKIGSNSLAIRYVRPTQKVEKLLASFFGEIGDFLISFRFTEKCIKIS